MTRPVNASVTRAVAWPRARTHVLVIALLFASASARVRAEGKHDAGAAAIAARNAPKAPTEGKPDVPPVLVTAQTVPKSLVSGPHFRLAPQAPNDGYVNHYTIESDYGRFEVDGKALLAIRVREVAAIAALDEVSKTKVFLESAAKSVAAPIQAAAKLATDPVDTVKGVPGGVKRTFKKLKRTAGNAKDAVAGDDDEGAEGESGPDKSKSEQAEALAKSYLGITSAHRKWAEKLGIDPYTSNPVLSKELDSVAKVDRVGKLAGSLAPIPGSAILGPVSTVTGLAWSKDPGELREINHKLLLDLGADEALAKRFLDNAWWSPSRQTAAVASLTALDGTAERSAFVAQAATARSEEEALFYQEAASLLASYHKSVGRIAALVENGPLVLARTASGKTVSLVPVDYLCWTPEVAKLVSASVTKNGKAAREIWVGDKASPRLKSEVTALGWKLAEDARTRLAPRP